MHPDQGTAADTVAGIARAVPGVTRLHPGRYGEVGTYLPGRRVAGVRILDRRVEVHLTVATDAPVRETAVAVRAAVAEAMPGFSVDVTVEDIAGFTRQEPTQEY